MYMEQDPTAGRNEGRCPGIWGARVPSRPPDRAFPGEPLTSPGCWPSTSSTLHFAAVRAAAPSISVEFCIMGTVARLLKTVLNP